MAAQIVSYVDLWEAQNDHLRQSLLSSCLLIIH